MNTTPWTRPIRRRHDAPPLEPRRARPDDTTVLLDTRRQDHVRALMLIGGATFGAGLLLGLFA